MNLEEKLKMARQLESLCVDVIEAGFPIASEGDFEAVRQVAKEVRSVIIAGLARATELDIRRAWEALQDAAKPRIHTFIATSDIHLQYKLKRTREQVLEQVAKALSGPLEEIRVVAAREIDRHGLRSCGEIGVRPMDRKWLRRIYRKRPVASIKAEPILEAFRIHRRRRQDQWRG